MRALSTLALAILLSACSSGAPVPAETAGTSTLGLGSAAGPTSGASSGSVASTTSAASSTSASASTSGSSTSSSTTSSSTGASSSGTSGASSGSGTSTTSGTTGAFRSAAHGDLPLVTNPSDNPVLTPIQVVTVTFQGYPYTRQVQDLGAYLAQSNYLGQAGAEYGLGPLVNQNADLAETAPAQINDLGIQSWILQEIAQQNLPPPSAGFSPLYVIYYPAGTTVTNELGATSCVSFSGYHLQAAYTFLSSTFSFYYAAVSDCGTGVADVENIGAHEIAEAASDPNDVNPTANAWVDRSLTSAWVVTTGITEIADLCEGQTLAADAGAEVLTLPQIWSDDAALDGGAPCVPVDPQRPYFAVSPDHDSQTVAAGNSAIFTLTGWSSGPIAPWALSVVPYQAAADSYLPSLALDTSTSGNGQRAHLIVTVPAGTNAGAVAGAFVYSQLPSGMYSVTPVLVYVQ